jgi:hypothetical protein
LADRVSSVRWLFFLHPNGLGQVSSQFEDQIKAGMISAQNSARIPGPRNRFLVIIKCNDSHRCHLLCKNGKNLTTHAGKLSTHQNMGSRNYRTHREKLWCIGATSTYLNPTGID